MKVVQEGVYVLLKNNEVVYVGESENLLSRIGEHIRENVKDFDAFDLYETHDRKALEAYLIKAFHPKYNISGGQIYNDFSYTEPCTSLTKLREVVSAYEHTIKSVGLGKATGLLDLNYVDGLRVLFKHSDEIPFWQNEKGGYEIEYEWFKDNFHLFKDWGIKEMVEGNREAPSVERKRERERQDKYEKRLQRKAQEKFDRKVKEGKAEYNYEPPWFSVRF